MAHAEERSKSRRGGRRSRRRTYRRLGRWARRYWPVWVLIIALGSLLVGVAVRNRNAAALQLKATKEDFGISVANLSGQPLRRVEVHLTWPDETAELTCRVDNVQPSEVLVRKIFAPAGSTIHIKVTLANGATNEGDRGLASGTIGGLRINVHAKGELGLE